jgi:hypothetical protein
MPSPPAERNATGRQSGSAGRIVRQVLANRGFVVCVLLLGSFTVSFEVLAKLRDIQFHPLAVPLKRPLSELDQSALRQRVFTLDASLRGHLYAGKPSLAVVEAFKSHGIVLGADAETRVKEPERIWQITDRNEKTNPEVSYTVQYDEAARQLDVYAPYRVMVATEIKPEILDQLGTDQYIQWVVLDQTHVGGASQPEDRSGAPRPENIMQLFVTYYTGTREQVPHVPEECYMGGGGYHVKMGDGEMIMDVPVPALGPGQTVPVKVLEFEGPALAAGGGAKIVMYLFHTNGQFCADRMCVRNVLADPFVRHAYFSKLELTFGTRDDLPTREKAIEAGKRFLAIVIPILLKDHWPDWDQVLRAEREARAAGKTQAK